MSWDKWDERFVALAGFVADWSKDPSTKCGAVIVRPDRTIASVGYNGFPRGVADTSARYEDRPTKYAMVVHAETNALLNAREPVSGCSMYCTFYPCSSCAAQMIQAGISRMICPDPTPAQIERWGDSFKHSAKMIAEAGVRLY